LTFLSCPGTKGSCGPAPAFRNGCDCTALASPKLVHGCECVNGACPKPMHPKIAALTMTCSKIRTRALLPPPLTPPGIYPRFVHAFSFLWFFKKGIHWGLFNADRLNFECRKALETYDATAKEAVRHSKHEQAKAEMRVANLEVRPFTFIHIDGNQRCHVTQTFSLFLSLPLSANAGTQSQTKGVQSFP